MEKNERSKKKVKEKKNFATQDLISNFSQKNSQQLKKCFSTQTFATFQILSKIITIPPIKQAQPANFLPYITISRNSLFSRSIKPFARATQLMSLNLHHVWSRNNNNIKNYWTWVRERILCGFHCHGKLSLPHLHKQKCSRDKLASSLCFRASSEFWDECLRDEEIKKVPWEALVSSSSDADDVFRVKKKDYEQTGDSDKLC